MAIPHHGTPNGILINITMGDVNGIILDHTIIVLSGVLRLLDIMIKAKMIGMVIGSINDCASWGSSLITLPMAANNEA